MIHKFSLSVITIIILIGISNVSFSYCLSPSEPFTIKPTAPYCLQSKDGCNQWKLDSIQEM